jgi:type VI protein secretion system component Hcp
MARRSSSAKVLLGAIVGIPLTMAVVVVAFSAATPAASKPSTQGALVLTISTGEQITLMMSSYSFAVQQPVLSAGSASGVTFAPFSITMKTDQFTPVLFEAAAEGGLFNSATLAVPTAGGGAGTFTFVNVSIASIAWQGGNGEIPTQSLTLNYTTLEMSCKTQSAATSSSFGWNRVTNSPTAAP